MDERTMRLLLEKYIENFRSEYDVQEGALDISGAVDKAYGDMMLRTIRGHTAAIKDESTGMLKEWFKEYFESPAPRDEKEFNAVHKVACNIFLTSFNEAAKENGVQEQAFGKAQKIVNMSFKYLYCMCRHKKASWFSYCHMPLDTYTLNWFYRTKEEKPPEKETWSNLGDKRYYEIANKIRAPDPKRFPGFSPLEAEFIIWNIEKSMASFKELKSSISRIEDNPIIDAYLSTACIGDLTKIREMDNLSFEKAYEYAVQKGKSLSIGNKDEHS